MFGEFPSAEIPTHNSKEQLYPKKVSSSLRHYGVCPPLVDPSRSYISTVTPPIHYSSETAPSSAVRTLFFLNVFKLKDLLGVRTCLVLNR